MPAEKCHKVIITGTSSAGTAFLIGLLTELGLSTGCTRTRGNDWDALSVAGWTGGVEDETSPYIVHDPALCETLPDVLARGRVTIDFAIVPVRPLQDAALERGTTGGSHPAPGSRAGAKASAVRQLTLAERFHQFMAALSAHDIPFGMLHFPRFTQDAAYTYEKLRPLLRNMERARFDVAFRRAALHPEFDRPGFPFRPLASVAPGARLRGFPTEALPRPAVVPPPLPLPPSRP